MKRTTRLTVRVIPGANRSEVVGVAADVVRVRVSAPPVEGRANQALIKLLAEVLDLPSSALSIVHGAGGRSKVVHVAGLDGATARERLTRAVR